MRPPPRPPAAPPPSRRDAREVAIERRARGFDAPALLDVLRDEFPDRPVSFRAHRANGPRPTLIEAVRFAAQSVEVVVNLGILSSSGPLPDYFEELFGHARGGTPLLELVETLDDHLIRARLATLWPEGSAWLWGEAARMRADIRAVARPATLAELHGLFSAVFPELEVRVQWTTLGQSVPIERARLGRPVLGIAALGGRTRARTTGFDVVLVTQESRDWGDRPWSREARDRVERVVVPHLRASGAHLRVFLVDREGTGELSVGPRSRLGLDPLGRAAAPRIVVLFEASVAAFTTAPATSGDPEATTVAGRIG